MALSYRTKGILGFFGWLGLGVGVLLGLSWTEDSRKEKFMEYYKTHPDELARLQEENARLMEILKKAARVNEDKSESSKK
ncbi:hypothetical protein JRQ81_009669 [Phrynocephalus forsythii]|uniref:Uncharacterized protein n=1 Tax=Phrynocephalus forsythii TaxID=171643 RepID=A0A9Q0XC29_9SAUR|nr:hypothetical protein JRQ81_009669 [Phrynocephalus forsythii]